MIWPLLTGYIYTQSLKKGVQTILILIAASFGTQMAITYIITGHIYERFIPFSRFW